MYMYPLSPPPTASNGGGGGVSSLTIYTINLMSETSLKDCSLILNGVCEHVMSNHYRTIECERTQYASIHAVRRLPRSIRRTLSPKGPFPTQSGDTVFWPSWIVFTG